MFIIISFIFTSMIFADKIAQVDQQKYIQDGSSFVGYAQRTMCIRNREKRRIKMKKPETTRAAEKIAEYVRRHPENYLVDVANDIIKKVCKKHEKSFVVEIERLTDLLFDHKICPDCGHKFTFGEEKNYIGTPLTYTCGCEEVRDFPDAANLAEEK